VSQPPARYKIVALRQGGNYGALCVVTRPEDPLRREVAMKVLRNTLMAQPTFLARARDEARMLGRLNHPNIIRVEGLMEVHGRHVIILEAIQGATLRQITDATGAIPVGIALAVIRTAARAMEHAYHGVEGDESDALRIVHRDLRPGNLFISHHGVLKLVDFGLARAEHGDRETSTVSTLLGSDGYIAPERFAGVPDDASVDVYSLGVTLLELLTLELPPVALLAPGHRDVFEQHLGLLPLRRPELAPILASLSALIQAMCAYERAERPSMAEVQASLQDIEARLPPSQTLQDFAAAIVNPLFEAEASKDPREHPDWDEVAFLEGIDSTGSHEKSDPTERANRRIRKRLAHPNWPDFYREVRDLLTLESAWTPDPFLPILEAAARPWWHFWNPAPPTAHVVAALKLVRRRRTPAVVHYARVLSAHRDTHIARAATKLLRAHAGD
jgi:serine/threonine protein kinase